MSSTQTGGWELQQGFKWKESVCLACAQTHTSDNVRSGSYASSMPAVSKCIATTKINYAPKCNNIDKRGIRTCHASERQHGLTGN